MLAEFGLEILEVKRSKIRLSIFYKILKKLIAIQISQLINNTNITRKNQAWAILQLQARASYYNYSFYSWAIPLWNVMPNILVEASP